VLKNIFSSSDNQNSSIGGFRWPTAYQWSQFFKVISKLERNLILALIFVIFVSLGFAGYRFYLVHTETVPGLGGALNEGIVGSPRYLNPVLSPANDADADLTRIIFSSLLKFNSDGGLIPDIAENYNVSSDGKTYDVYLKKNVFWHDGQPLTADDVVFTLKIIQDQNYRSPLRYNWSGVDVQKTDQFALRFILKNAYAPFPYNLTFGILPKHIWQNVSATDFALNERNLKPIGSGPYVFVQLEKNKDGSITSVQLQASKNYYLNGPFIANLNFRFYADEDKALAALKKAEINGLNYISAQNESSLVANPKNSDNILKLSLPRYFALFINQSQNKALADKNVREALARAIDKDKLINDILAGFGQKIDSPIIPGMLGYTNQVKTYPFDPEKAKATLDSAGWKDIDNDGVREKDGVKLQISLVTIPWPELSKTASLLKDFWAAIGVKLDVETKETANLIEENVRPRQYQILLFGELMNVDPDPFAFWHSSQIKDPGQNLSMYENSKVDAILQNARQDLNPETRAQKYQQFSQIIAEDLPAIFLFAPDYLYPISRNINNVNPKFITSPSDRFSQIENWYITTKRAWKK